MCGVGKGGVCVQWDVWVWCMYVCVVCMCRWDRAGVRDGGKEEAFCSPGN